MENKKEKVLKIIMPGFFVLAFVYAPALLYLLIRVLRIDDITSQVIADFIYLLIIVFLFRKSLKREFLDYEKNYNSYIKIGMKSWLIGLGIMLISNIIINVFIFNGNIAGNEQAIRNLLSDYPVQLVISSVIFAPIIEEITFRKILKNSINTKWVFIFISAFIFGFLHAITDISSMLSFLYIIPYGALGGAFAYMDYETDSIFTSMTFHFLHNFITIVLLFSVKGIVV